MTTTNESSIADDELIQLALDGERYGFEQLVRRYRDRIFKSVRYQVGCPNLADDIVQETFLRAFLNLGSFRQQSKFFTWLYCIARNVGHSFARRRRDTLPLEALHDCPAQCWTGPHQSPQWNLEQRETREQVREALSRISESHRQLLILREFDGLSYKKIEEVLQLRSGTVRSRLARARAQLKKELKPGRFHSSRKSA